LDRVGDDISRLEESIAAHTAVAADAGLCEYFPDVVAASATQGHVRAPRVPGSLVREDITRDDFDILDNL